MIIFKESEKEGWKKDNGSKEELPINGYGFSAALIFTEKSNQANSISQYGPFVLSLFTMSFRLNIYFIKKKTGRDQYISTGNTKGLVLLMNCLSFAQDSILSAFKNKLSAQNSD